MCMGTILLTETVKCDINRISFKCNTETLPTKLLEILKMLL